MTQNILHQLTQKLLDQGLKIVTAESCTAGLVAKLLTDQAGSSSWFERGFVVYSNEAKMEMLGVSHKTLDKHGAVSRQTVHQMAEGALKNSYADIALAISGVAGPYGGSEERPVGTVWFAWGAESSLYEQMHRFHGNRGEVRLAAAQFALAGVLRQISI